MTHTIPAAPNTGRRTIRLRLAGLLASATLLGAVACSNGDSSTGPAKQDPTGAYRLTLVEGKPIPFVIYDGPYYDPEVDYTYNLMLRVVSGEVTLEKGGGFHLAVDRVWNAEGEAGKGVLTVDGTYRIQGNQILIDTDNGSGTGAFENGDIRLSLDVGETGAFKKYTFHRT